MKSVRLDSHKHLAGPPRTGILAGLARSLVLGRFARLENGSLLLVDGETRHRFGDTADEADLCTEIRVLDRSFYADIAFGGSVGAGEAYMRGAWECDDLVALVCILLRNREALEGLDKGAARLAEPVKKLFHWVNRNTREGSRRNIAAHYDLGNDFFRLWLDESMMYSSAIFEDPFDSLGDAQRHRLDVVCRELDLGPDDHVIEIGTGWGGFAIHAARNYGCRVTTTTISGEQHALARQRVADAGLSDRIELLRKDYRDLDGQYDKLVSIEMIEAVGAEYYDAFFAKCAGLLRPGGAMLIQAITIADRRYEQARRQVDFIKRYIFPGGCLPSLSVMVNSITRAGGMQVTGVRDIGRDYALTLGHWRRNFFERIEEVRGLGYREEFIRMWEFYLTYCEGAFWERAISDVHLVAEKPA